MGSVVKELQSKAELDEVVKEGTPACLHFWASWCDASAQMDLVFAQLASVHPSTRFFRVEAEEVPDISVLYQVAAVPFFVFLKDGAVVDKLLGVNPAELANKVGQLATSQNGSVTKMSGDSQDRRVPANEGKAIQSSPVENGDSAKKRLEALTSSKPIMLFMKGSPDEPGCGFSRQVVELLGELGVSFGSFDILSDESVRQGLKSFSNWPTYPQLYVAGELIGGCDIVTEMHKSGELKELLAAKGLLADEESPEAKLQKLINSSPTMLFMKGTPDTPRCGFSSKVVNILKEEGLSFGSFDILTNAEVRQGLKTYSNWPTYPQLYHKGELIGGCDIILEMKESGELKSTLS